MTFSNYIITELDEVARKLVSNFSQIKVWCFYGEMGVGKTTLIKTICKEMGVTDDVSSATFSIVNEYCNQHHEPIYHFDLYRLQDIAETMDIGMEDYLHSGYHNLIEWPQIATPILPDHYLKININLVDDKARMLTATPQ